MSIYSLKGVVQHYAWGGTTFIPQLLKVKNVNQQPFAEFWMGTHIKGPAKLIKSDTEVSLSEFIQDAPITRLGKQSAARFQNQLPFLFKVLDVKKMLSIQAHPTKKEAELGFVRENKLGIERTAPNRTYRDDNHKPEIMVALTDFWLLHGFKSIEEIHTTLEIPAFKPLQPFFVNDDILSLYKAIMEMPQAKVNTLLAPLWERLQTQWEKGYLTKDNPDYWAAQAFQDYTKDGQYDRGIFSIYLFNLVNIPKGAGIFQAAGIPHAYLEGANMELMANSDNVFRGGLTQKHIDVPELLKHLIFDPIVPKILNGEQISPLEKVFKTPAPDFELSQINLSSKDTYRMTITPSAEILIVMNGAAIINCDGQKVTYGTGMTCFVEANTAYQISSSSNCQLFKAKVPV